MAFRNIPKKFDMAEIAAELKNVLQYSDCIDSSVIDEIARILGCKKRTVYAVLSGEIILNLDFLHAAVIATNGDPEVRKYLEPAGFSLSVCDSTLSTGKETLAEECLDDLPVVAEYHKLLMSPDAKFADVKRAYDRVCRKLHQNLVYWSQNNNR
jgi:hypothetical protein